MAAIPRLPPAVEHRVLKFACNLPARVQRRIFGPAPQLDGQTLAADIHVLISLAARARSDSLAEGADPAEARAQRRAEAAIVAERPTIAMARVEGGRDPGAGGPDPGPPLRPRRRRGRSAAAARLLPRRWLGDRRPRDP